MAYWRLFYHIVFATRDREPMITPEIESRLWGFIADKARRLEAIVYAVGGTRDHVHIVAAIPPKVTIATLVGEVKGASAHYTNHHMLEPPAPRLEWQRGYGILSFGEKDLQRIVDYVRRQKEHHREGTTIAALERVEEKDDAPKGPFARKEPEHPEP